MVREGNWVGMEFRKNSLCEARGECIVDFRLEIDVAGSVLLQWKDYFLRKTGRKRTIPEADKFPSEV